MYDKLTRIGSSKIGKTSPKSGKVYPLMRFPTQCHYLIGKGVTIYKTAHEGKDAFLAVIEPTIGDTTSQDQLKNLDSRLTTMENQLGTIQNMLDNLLKQNRD